MEKSDIEVLLILHNEKNRGLLKQVCHGLQIQDIPCTISVFYDSETPADELDFVRDYHFDNYICTPPEINHNPALRHKYAYDLSKARYVAFCQGDDPPFQSRIRRQIETLNGCGISCAAFYYCTNENTATMYYHKFTTNPYWGFSNGMPSGWLIDKQMLPEFPELIGFEVPWEWEWDTIMLCEIADKVKKVQLMTEALLIYNFHTGGSTQDHIPDWRKQFGEKRLERHFRKIRSKYQ